MKRVIRIIVIIICILVCLGGAAYLVSEHFKREENQDVYGKLQEQVQTGLDIQAKKKEPDYIPIDFKKLKETNEDIYAWITIEGTRVDYPIVQHPTDDNYYLDYTIDGRKGYPGSIYTQSCNAKDFSDFNTVVYGHNMKNGTMFKDLHKFENADFFKKHDKITVYTETEHKEYQIFAAVVYSDRHIVYGYNYESQKGREKFLQSLKESHSMKNQYREDVVIEEDSHLLTLSTCIGGRPNNRFIVVAVEIDD